MSYLQHQIASLLRSAAVIAPVEPYYEVLQYIELDGTQYFNLGFKSSADIDYEIGVQFDDLTNNVGYGVCGSRDNGASGNNIGSFSGTTSSIVVDFNNSDYSTYRYTILKTSLSTSDWYDIWNNKNSRGMKLNGTNVGTPNTTVCSDSFTTENDFYLGGYNGFTLTPMKGKIRYFKCHNPEMDMIPVLDSQMRPCFYDKISKRFFYHQNSTGSTVPTYARWNKFDVDYIESSGTQYIDTGYKFMDTSAFELTCAKVGDFTDSSVYCGARNGTDTTTNARVLDYRYSAPNVLRGDFILLQRGGYDVQNNVIYIPCDNNFHTYYESPTRMSIDDTDRETVPSLVSPNLNFYIFWQNVGNATAPNKSSIKVKSCKLWDNGTLVRNFQPTVWHNGNTTAVACMYDKVYNKMYTNAGTGSLKAYIVDISKNKIDVFTTTGETSGKAINAEGQIINSSASSYSALLPIVGGSVIECVSGNTGNNNYRYHCYDSSGVWIEQSLVLFPEGAGTVEPITGSFTAPDNAKYVRVSYATAASSTIQVKSKVETTYEVGSNCFVSPATASQQVTNNYFNSGMYGNEEWNVKLISFTSTNVSGQLFGNFISSSATNNLTINSGTATGTGTISRFDGQAMSQDKIINMGSNEKSLLQMNKIGAWKDSTQIVAWSSPNSFTTTGTCYICGTNGSATVRPNGCCYLLIEENFVPIAEFIPVKNKTVTSEYGLYDRVSGTLNTGVGTITFNALS